MLVRLRWNHKSPKVRALSVVCRRVKINTRDPARLDIKSMVCRVSMRYGRPQRAASSTRCRMKLRWGGVELAAQSDGCGASCTPLSSSFFLHAGHISPASPLMIAVSAAMRL